ARDPYVSKARYNNRCNFLLAAPIATIPAAFLAAFPAPFPARALLLLLLIAAAVSLLVLIALPVAAV
ncbi:hypothetical protein V8C34DRAFT_286840, partial [Trichoderma compactum]